MPPLPTHTHSPPTVNSLLQVGHLLRWMNLGTRPNHTKSIVHIRAHSWSCTSMGLDNCIMTGVDHTPHSLTALKVFCAWPVHPFLPQPHSRQTDLFTVSTVMPFPECPVVGITQYVSFSDWLLSLCNRHLRFLRAIHGSSFFFTHANIFEYLPLHQAHSGHQENGSGKMGMAPTLWTYSLAGDIKRRKYLSVKNNMLRERTRWT